MQTQRELYNLTLFNQVTTAVENPGGDEPSKNVLVQFDEARRWDVTYGARISGADGHAEHELPESSEPDRAGHQSVDVFLQSEWQIWSERAGGTRRFAD